jgi:hypothetical protein
MPRSSVLIPLSRDHHRDLVHARRLQAAARNTPPERVAAARAFVAFFGMHMVTHFRREEEPCSRCSSTRTAKIAHCSCRLCSTTNGCTRSRPTSRTSSTLTLSPPSARQHRLFARVTRRLEERRLFPLVEKLAGDRLDEVARELLADSPVFDFLAGEDEGPLWGTASGDLNVTYSRGIQAPPHRST